MSSGLSAGVDCSHSQGIKTSSAGGVVRPTLAIDDVPVTGSLRINSNPWLSACQCPAKGSSWNCFSEKIASIVKAAAGVAFSCAERNAADLLKAIPASNRMIDRSDRRALCIASSWCDELNEVSVLLLSVWAVSQRPQYNHGTVV